MTDKIKNKEFVVRDILTKHPKTRDSDSLLLSYVWVYQAGGKDYIEDISFNLFTASSFIIFLSYKLS